MEHSPGPWRAEDQEVGVGYGKHLTDAIVDSEGNTVLLLPDFSPPQREANLKLAVAGPDLLFALTRAEALLMDGPAAEFLDEEEVKGMCREAIVKAGGECRV